MNREQVIALILQMINENQKEYATEVYSRENANHPEWSLFDGIKQALEQQ